METAGEKHAQKFDSETVTKFGLDQERFSRDGVCDVESQQFFDDSQYLKLQDELNSMFLSWKQGELEDHQRATGNPLLAWDRVENNVQYIGLPLSHRLNRGYGAIDSFENQNWLSGKKGVLRPQYFPSSLISYLDQLGLDNFLSNFLNCESLELVDAEIYKVYPGHVSEARWKMDGAYYAQATGTNFFADIDNIFSVVIPLDEVPQGGPELLAKNGSHQRCKEILKIAEDSLGASGVSFFKRPGGLFSELIPAELGKDTTISISKGKMILVNGRSLYQMSENRSDQAPTFFHLMFRSAHFPQETKKFIENSWYKEYRSTFRKIKVAQSVDFIGGAKLLKQEPLISKIRKLDRKLRNISHPFRKKIKHFIFPAAPLEKRVALNLGCGDNWFHDEFIGMDVVGNVDVCFDFLGNEKLPFEDGRFEVVYTSHCFEHLLWEDLLKTSREVLRVLKPGGVFRIITPDAELFHEAYKAKNASFFSWIYNNGTYAYDSWIRLVVRSIADSVVDKYSDEELSRLYDKYSYDVEDLWNQFEMDTNSSDVSCLIPSSHKCWVTHGRLISAMKKIGFSQVERSKRGNSAHKVLRNQKIFDRTRPHMSLYVEAIK